MTRDTEAALLDFCARQREQFDPASWLSVPHPDRDEFLAAVLFLVGVEWYGHRSLLRAVAGELAPGAAVELSEVVRRTRFDLSRFSTLLRRRLKHESVVRAS